MDNLTSGRIPIFYRDVYDVLCPAGERMDRDTFTRLFLSSALSKDALKQIWDSVESCTGYVTRDGFFKALALLALAEKCQEVNPRQLDNWDAGRDLPVPNIGSIEEIRARFQKLQLSRDPLRLAQSYKEICEIDAITVEFADRKGVFFKHQEYKVNSHRYGTSVYRRYNDFDAFREYLIQRFPYRIVPALPPKSAILNSSKIEKRKKELSNFLTIVTRHPAMCDDSIVRAFLVYPGSDVMNHYKMETERIPDEFMTNEIAPKVKSVLHGNVVEFLSINNALLRELTRRMTRIVEALRSLLSRQHALCNDISSIATELGAVANLRPPRPLSSRGDLREEDSWLPLASCLSDLGEPVMSICHKSRKHADASDDGVLHNLELFLCLLEGYETLLQRLEKGVAAKHKQAISKMATYRKRQISATTSSRGGREQDEGALRQLEQRIMEQDKELSNQENRIQFSQFCQLHEIQLIFRHVDLLHFALLNLVRVNVIGSAEMSQIWAQIQPIVEKLVSTCVKDSQS